MAPPGLRTYVNKKKSQRQNKQSNTSYVKPNIKKILTDSSNYNLRGNYKPTYMLRSKKNVISPLPSNSTVSSSYDTSETSIHVALPETTFDRLKKGENAMKKTTKNNNFISSSLETSCMSKTSSFESLTENHTKPVKKKQMVGKKLYETSSSLSNESECLESLLVGNKQRPTQESLSTNTTSSTYDTTESSIHVALPKTNFGRLKTGESAMKKPTRSLDTSCMSKTSSFESLTKNHMKPVKKKQKTATKVYETRSYVSSKSEYMESLLIEKEQRPVQSSLSFSPYESTEQKSNIDDICKDQNVLENSASLDLLSITGPVMVSTPKLSCPQSNAFVHGNTSPIVKITNILTNACVLLERLPTTDIKKKNATNVSNNICGLHTTNIEMSQRNSKYSTPKISNNFDGDPPTLQVIKQKNELKLSIENGSRKKNINKTENSSGNGLNLNECDVSITDCTPIKVKNKEIIAINLSRKYFSDDNFSIQNQREQQCTKNSNSKSQHSEIDDCLNDKTKHNIDHATQSQKQIFSESELFSSLDNIPLSKFITKRRKNGRKHSDTEMNLSRKSDKNTTDEKRVDTPDLKSDAYMSEEDIFKSIEEVIIIDSSLELQDTPIPQSIKDDNSDYLRKVSSPFFLYPGKKWRRQLSILTTDCDNESKSVKKGRKWRETVNDLVQLQKSKNDTCSRNTIHKIDSVRISQRRTTIAHPKNFIRILPISTQDNCSLKASQDESSFSLVHAYAHSGYVPQQIDGLSTGCESGLESDFTNLSVKPTVTAADIVLDRCKQTRPEDFLQVYPDNILQKCLKIGEGVYGEVFLFKASDGRATVMKVIPIEGNLKINGDYQKKYSEIVVEIIITQELSNLRLNKCNGTSCFAEVQAVQCVKGKYPQRLLELWDIYDEQSGSENDRPDFFPANQQYIVLELAHAGRDLEAYVFDSAEQAYSIFVQTVYALAVAEAACQFEHRDLHWGNLMISPTDDREISFWLNNEEFKVPTNGVKATIIDFTLSRITYDGACLFFDLAKEEDLFQSEGDHQFDVYRLMKQHNRNNWETFKPFTNILWLHYIIKKMIDGARYLQKKKKNHKVYIKKMIELELIILSFDSAHNFINSVLKEMMF